jgi:hypothetical protein
MLVLGSWALEMLILGWLPRMAVKRNGSDALRDLRMVWLMVWVVRTFVMLTLLLLAAMCVTASDGQPDLPRDASGLQPDLLLQVLRSEHAVVGRMQHTLVATLMYLALQTLAFNWMRVYSRSSSETVKPA